VCQPGAEKAQAVGGAVALTGHTEHTENAVCHPSLPARSPRMLRLLSRLKSVIDSKL
jgi:hypothetical protein